MNKETKPFVLIISKLANMTYAKIVAQWRNVMSMGIVLYAYIDFKIGLSEAGRVVKEQRLRLDTGGLWVRTQQQWSRLFQMTV